MLEDLKKDIEKLIALYEGQKVENEKLTEALAKSREECQAKKEKIEELEHQIDNLKLAEAFGVTSGSNSEAKEKIAKLVKEIDKCIALLEK